MISRTRLIQRSVLGVVVAASLALTGCANPGAATSAPSRSASSDAAGSTSYPLTEDNCGRDLHFDAAPKRIVSLWPAITEMLISLGAADDVVGQAFTDQSPPLDEYKAAYDSIPVLASNSVDRETLLAAKPELVVADGEYHFDGTELPTIDDLAELGIQVYIISSFCNGSVTTGHVADAQTDLASLGRILDSGSAADGLIADQKATLAGVEKKATGTDTVPLALIQYYDTDLYADARGIYSDVVDLAGGSNLYDDELPADQYYGQVSVEDFVKKNPGTIVYLYNSDDDKASQLVTITSQLASVDAVKNGRVYALPSTDFIGSRAVDGLVELSALLHP